MKIYLPRSLDTEIASRQEDVRKIYEVFHGLFYEVQKQARQPAAPSNIAEEITRLSGGTAANESVRSFLASLEKDISLRIPRYTTPEFVTEMTFHLFGRDNTVQEAIFCGYSESLCSEPWIREMLGLDRIQQEYMEKRGKCKLPHIANLHAHTTCQLLVNKGLIASIELHAVRQFIDEEQPDTSSFQALFRTIPPIPDNVCSPSAYCFSLPDLKGLLKRQDKKIEILYCQLEKKYIGVNTPQMEMVAVELY